MKKKNLLVVDEVFVEDQITDDIKIKDLPRGQYEITVGDDLIIVEVKRDGEQKRDS